MDSKCHDIFSSIFKNSLNLPGDNFSREQLDDISKLAAEAYYEIAAGKAKEESSILVWCMHKINEDIALFIKEAKIISDQNQLKRELETSCFSAVHTPEVREALAYRFRLPVRQMLVHDNGEAYPICPRCKTSFERDYTNYCTNCGQRLWWRAYKHAELIDINEKTRNLDT